MTTPNNEHELIRVKGPALPMVTLRSEVNPTAEPSELIRVTGPALPPATLRCEPIPPVTSTPASSSDVSKLADMLTSSPIGQLRRLVVIADDNQVIITGQVSSYYFKQMAQETVQPLIGTRLLLNNVEVSFEAA
jgi:hypothetical protein